MTLTTSPLSDPSLAGDGDSCPSLSDRFRAFHELLPRVQNNQQQESHHHRQPASFSEHSFLDLLAVSCADPRSPSDSLYVHLSGRRNRFTRRSSKQHLRHRFLYHSKTSHAPTELPAHPTSTVSVDGETQAEPAMATVTSTTPIRAADTTFTAADQGRRRHHQGRFFTRGERIGARLRGPDGLLHKAILVPVLVLLAVPAAVLTCPVCVFIIVKNSFQAS